MEFVSVVKDMLTVVGDVTLLDNEKGIQMELPPGRDEISKIVYGHTSAGRNYIETVSLTNDVWPVYGEASLPEIMAFARKAQQDRPHSVFTKELVEIVRNLELVLS